MAVFSTNTIGNISSADDLNKVKNYLYKLNEDLDYMFRNLTPEDNYSEVAKLTYVAQGEKIAQLEVSVDDISIIVQDTQQNYKSSIEVLANLLSLNVSTPEGSTSAVLSGDRIALTTGKFVVNSKNLVITETGDATFSGKVSAAAIEGSTLNGGEITVGVFNADDDGCTLGEWIVAGANRSILRSQNGKIYFFAEDGKIQTGEGGLADGTSIYSDEIRTGEVYLSRDSWWGAWSVTRAIKAMWNALKDAGYDPNDYD